VTPPALRFAGVGKHFGATRVLESFDLEIAEGELFVLLGPSGCGKTTILRMTAGLESVSSGEIYLRGEPISKAPPEKRDIAMVFQDYALYPHMTVYKNMAFGLRRHGIGQAEADARIHKTAAMLGIERLLQRRPHQLSGGQQQRVALGRAIVRDPSLYLMDEPLSNLDAQVRSIVRTEIKELQRRLGVTTLYVTHDQLEAMTLADRMAVLNAGVVQQIGAPIEIYRQPANEFVARFLATPRLNVFDGSIERDGGQVAVRTALGVFRWPEPAVGAPASGATVHVGLRPEEIKIGFAPAPGGVGFPIELVELLGSQVLLFSHIGEEQVVVCAPADSVPSNPSSFTIEPAGSTVHLFDRAGGDALGHFVSA
jgi:ABC-type sugar transport system ATPase subunit